MRKKKYTFIRPVILPGVEKWVVYEGNTWTWVGEIIAKMNEEEKSVTVESILVRKGWENCGIKSGLVKHLLTGVPLNYSLVFSPEVVYQMRV